MKRGKILAAMLAVAGVGVLAFGAGSTPASAQAYAACAPGYYYSAGYCYPNPPPPVVYYPPAYYAPPPVVFGPTIDFGFGFRGGDHDRGGDFRGGGHR
ncbi:MAG TPA: hypothetical protein VGP48_10445 [Stellaceae bacterium]|jgi:hypothetical protein|nr:hypothetical protein [Stellaceae bacterium]